MAEGEGNWSGATFLGNSHSNVKLPSSSIIHISLFRHLPREKKIEVSHVSLLTGGEIFSPKNKTYF